MSKDIYEIHIGDYVQGIENTGISKVMRGWVGGITDSGVLIQADDSYDGNRGAILRKDSVYPIMNRIPEWWRVNIRRIKPGSKVRHFKGHIYVLDRYARHVDFGDVAIYHNINDESEVWVRDSIEFNSKNTKAEYDAEYRFTVID